MPGAYLGFLLFGLAGVTASDYRWKLALFSNTRQTIATLITSVLVFLVWDIAGIGLHIFFEGNTKLLLGVDLAPQLPIEEPLFLLLLSYSILLCYQGWQRRKR